MGRGRIWSIDDGVDLSGLGIDGFRHGRFLRLRFGRLSLASRALRMDTGARVDRLLTDGAARSGGDWRMQVFWIHVEIPVRLKRIAK